MVNRSSSPPVEPLRAKHLGPVFEREVGSDGRRAALVTLREDLEQQLGAGRGFRYIAKLVDNEQFHSCKVALELEQAPLVTGLLSWLTSFAAGVNATVKLFWQAARPSARATCVLPAARQSGCERCDNQDENRGGCGGIGRSPEPT